MNAKQNYDFSTLKMASATSKQVRLDEDGKPIPYNRDEDKSRQ